MSGYTNNSHKKQKLYEPDKDYSTNNGTNAKKTQQPLRVPVHLLPLVSDESRSFIIPEPLPNSVSHLKPPVYSVRKYLSNMAILRIYEIINMISLSVKQAISGLKDLPDKTEFAKKLEPSIMILDKMFAPYGSVHYVISSTASNVKIRTFELSVLSFLFFFKGWMENMVNADLEMFINNLKAQVLNNGTIYVESNEFIIMKSYPDGSRTIKKFNIKVIFDSWLKIEFLEIVRLEADLFASETSLSLNNLNKNGDLDQLLQFILDRKLDKKPAKKKKFESIKSNLDNENIDSTFGDVYQSKKTDELPFPNYTSAPQYDVDEEEAAVEEESGNQLSDNELLVQFLRKKTESFGLESEFNTPSNFLKSLQLSDVMTNLKNLMLYQRINNVESPMESMFKFVSELRKREREILNK